MNTLTIAIPCYRSEKYLRNTVEGILAEAHRQGRDDLRVLLVDDGSPDGTFQVIKELCGEHKGRVTGICLAENAGQANARAAAFHFLRGGVTVLMDDDGQHDPRGIFQLEKKILDGYDLVYAQFPKMEEAPLRRLGSLSLDVFLALFTKKPRGLRITSFLALSEPALLELKKYKSHHPFIGGWLFVHGYRAGGVLVRHRARETGRSNYTIKKLLLRAAELMFLFRLRPGKGSPPAFRIREIVGGYGKKNRAPSLRSE